MKKCYILLFCSLFTLHCSLAQQYGWKDISTNIPIQAELTDVFFTSENEGWITTAFANASILHTTDGGETFETQHVPLGVSIHTIHMIDSVNGYCGGDGGWVYKTTDGGKNWNILATMGNLLDISFPFGTTADNPIGYASGDEGRVWEITSTLTNLNSPSSTTLSGVSAPTVNNAWVCGGGRIYYYNGIGFTSQVGPVGTYNDIHFINNLVGWVVGNGGIIGHTEDGTGWATQTNPDIQKRSLFGVFFIDSDNGWLVGGEGIILHTTNGGTDLSVEADGLTTEGLAAVYFTSPTNGYVVGNNKTLLKYTEVSGVEEVGSILFEIYPNPAKDKFTIQSSEFKVENASLEIFNLHGRKLLEKQITTGTEEVEMDVSNLQSGVYFCRLNTENKSVTKKIIIQK